MWRKPNIYSGKSELRKLNSLWNYPKKLNVTTGKLAEKLDESLIAAPPKETRVVICGGGVVGAAVAYHLGQMGWGPQTILIEGGRLSSSFL